MPAGPTDPALPSGDVMPIPGEAVEPVGPTCDMAGAPPRNSIAAIGSRRFIAVSITCFVQRSGMIGNLESAGFGV
jgi:hypothetical protein